jgi:hypothetical protein
VRDYVKQKSFLIFYWKQYTLYEERERGREREREREREKQKIKFLKILQSFIL